MRIIIDCEPEHIPEAVRIMQQELADFEKYTKVGWGWNFGNYRTGPRFFVRRLKDGLSIRDVHENTIAKIDSEMEKEQ